MSEPAISLDDAGYQNLRAVADRLLETTRGHLTNLARHGLE